jgi:PAS domain S-box-containing protein
MKKKLLPHISMYAGILGFITGCAALIIFYLASLSSNNLGFSWQSIQTLHQNNSILWILFLIPFSIGFLAFYFAKKYDKTLTKIRNIADFEISKTHEIANYTKALAEGNYKIDISIDDSIGKSIKHLRDSLISSQEESARHKLEESHHNWATEGLTFFAEILRKNNDNIQELSYQIITNLVKYTGANQGGFFVLQDDNVDDKHFELIACYAYERKKFANKRVEWGEGLLGMCGLELEPIYMTDVPDNYIHITSGMGDANPRCIFIVPLILNDTIQGIIELASFKVFEKYERDFVIKLSESIASTIYSVKNNMRTATLLAQSKEQALHLSQQEDQLKQNIEELRATQEQAALQTMQFENFVNSVNHTMMSAEFDIQGKLIHANNKFLQKLSYQKETDVIGKNIYQMINERDTELFHETWSSLIIGSNYFEGEFKFLNKFGEDFWIVCTFLYMKNSENVIDKILFLGTDINEQKKKNLDYEGQIQALNISSLKAEFHTTGTFILGNTEFYNVVGLTEGEMEEKTFFDIIPSEDIDELKNIWHNVTQDNPFKGQLRFISSESTEKWFQTTIAPVKDVYETVIKIVIIANDITEQKIMELETNRQSEILKEQEEKLRSSQTELAKKLDEARKEMREQFHEIETIKIRNEKTLEGALDAIITFNQNGYIQFFNKAAEDLLGYDKTEILQKQISILFSDTTKESDDFVKGIVSAGTNKPVGYRKEVCFTAKDGNELNVLVLLSEAEVQNAYTYTAFIQNIEVELF